MNLKYRFLPCNKQTNLHIEWPEGENIFGGTIPLMDEITI